jgi:hypothetical protein
VAKRRGYARTGQADARYKLLCLHIHPLTMRAQYTINHLQIRGSFRLVTSDKITVNVQSGQLTTMTGMCRQYMGREVDYLPMCPAKYGNRTWI